MITEHPVFEAPADRNVPVWRYMSLAHFVWMLQHNALYFCRCDRLGDPYEGHPTRLLASEDEFVRMMLANPAFRQEPEAEKLARSFFPQYRNMPSKLKEQVFVSCWHMNQNESKPMWTLYTSHPESICVRSTYSHLAEALPQKCLLGRVKYIDYDRDVFNSENVLNYVIHKREGLAHEREVRAVIWKTAPGDPPFRLMGDQGMVVPVESQRAYSRDICQS
jgi:hypothetical protein